MCISCPFCMALYGCSNIIHAGNPADQPKNKVFNNATEIGLYPSFLFRTCTVVKNPAVSNVTTHVRIHTPACTRTYVVYACPTVFLLFVPFIPQMKNQFSYDHRMGFRWWKPILCHQDLTKNGFPVVETHFVNSFFFK
jgi:hypothetical protein